MADILENKTDDFDVKVSTVLNRQVNEYGKLFMFDGREDTCWNSDQGSPQWIRISFSEEVEISHVQIMFQGGFAGKTCWLETSKDGDLFEKLEDIFPEDVNKLQTFPIKKDNGVVLCKGFKILFADSTDFFGRITIYQMKLIAK